MEYKVGEESRRGTDEAAAQRHFEYKQVFMKDNKFNFWLIEFERSQVKLSNW